MSAPVPPDATTRAILNAGLKVFGEDGYERTTMRRVASEAEVSRPTLYTRFPNKEELFRAVLIDLFEDNLSRVEAIIDAGGPFPKVLSDVLLAYFGRLFERVSQLPHADELLRQQAKHAREVTVKARKRFRGQLSRLLRERDKTEDIDLEAAGLPLSQVVDLIVLSPLAFKEPGLTVSQYTRRLKNLAQLMARGLRPG